MTSTYPQLLRGVRALVTGADGFIGSHLVERLLREGAQVTAFCLYNSNGSHGWLDESDSRDDEYLELVLGDIRDARLVREAVAGHDLVFHLAALIAIPYSYLAPTSYVETNVVGTLNLLEAVRETRGARMINTSTSEVYGTPETTPIRETHPLCGQSPYAATKIAADQLCQSYARSFGTDVVSLRPFNTFGPRQSARAVIPTILNQLLVGEREVRLGNLNPRRDLTYVDDTVDGFVRMARASLAPGSLVQLGTGRSVSVGELFDLCCEVTGNRAEVSVDQERVRPDDGEVQVLLSDPSRAKSDLGWQAEVGLREGLERTAEWLKPRIDPANAGRYQR